MRQVFTCLLTRGLYIYIDVKKTKLHTFINFVNAAIALCKQTRKHIVNGILRTTVHK